MLKIKELSKKTADKTVVDNFNLFMPAAGISAIVGKEGSGKTSAVRMIAGIMKKTSGKVLWNDVALEKSDCKLSYLPQICEIYPTADLLSQLFYFAALKGVGKAEAKQRIFSLSEEFGILHILYPEKNAVNSHQSRHSRFEELDNDEKFKILLAVTVLNDPDLIILDEPSATLSNDGKRFLKNYLKKQVRFGKYIIIATRDISFADSVCTDVAVLRKSKTILSGNLNDLKKSVGKIRLTIETDSDISDIAEKFGAEHLGAFENEYEMILNDENEAENLLIKVIASGITVHRYETRGLALDKIIRLRCGEEI